ncbi:MAG: CoA ester lyase [Pseudomonadales bacterium]|nr:CoA ester lyase [Pseudomonadales bacterium]
MHQRPQRPRRSQLAVPGSDDKKMAKAAQSRADHVFLDLEDAVAPSAKKPARQQIVTALTTLDWGHKVRCVRINDLETRYAYGDIIEVVSGARDQLDVLMIPKVKRAADVIWVDILLSQLEADLGLDRPIGIEVLIEEVEAMMRVEEIAFSSPRLEALIFGMGDYSASQGIDVRAIGGATSYPGDLWHYQRNKMVAAARAAGIDPIDGPFGNFRNEEGYREECRRALTLGCVGKWAIHPAQIEPALEIFTPDPADVARARKMDEAYAEAEAAGIGAIQVDGVLVDAASVRIQRNIVRRANLVGV